ncbi:UNVERIFIED_CONTAM: hypothetical protein K2H54_028273 [Gekko kuhli]
MTITMGKGRYWTSSTECCTTDKCNAGPISAPAVSLTPNGGVCPACFTIGSNCKGDVIEECTGAQDRCVTASGVADGVQVEFIAKGCGTATTCSLPLGKPLHSTGITLSFTSITCDPFPSDESGQ